MTPTPRKSSTPRKQSTPRKSKDSSKTDKIDKTELMSNKDDRADKKKQSSGTSKEESIEKENIKNENIKKDESDTIDKGESVTTDKGESDSDSSSEIVLKDTSDAEEVGLVKTNSEIKNGEKESIDESDSDTDESDTTLESDTDESDSDVVLKDTDSVTGNNPDSDSERDTETSDSESESVPKKKEIKKDLKNKIEESDSKSDSDEGDSEDKIDESDSDHEIDESDSDHEIDESDSEEEIDESNSEEVKNKDESEKVPMKKMKAEDFKPYFEPKLTVFIKGLSPLVTELMIEEEMQKIGGVVEVRMPRSENSNNKGMAYIDFKDQKSANKAFLLNGEKRFGCILSVDWAKEGKFERVERGGNENTIHIGNLPYEMDVSKLENYFGKYAEVVALRVPKDPIKPNRYRGFGFLQLANESDVEKVIKKKHIFEDRVLKVSPVANNGNREDVKRRDFKNNNSKGEFKGNNKKSRYFEYEGYKKKAPERNNKKIKFDDDSD